MTTIDAAEDRSPSYVDLTFGAGSRLQLGSRPARILVVSDEHSARAIQRRLESFGAQVQALVAPREIVATAKR